MQIKLQTAGLTGLQFGPNLNFVSVTWFWRDLVKVAFYCKVSELDISWRSNTNVMAVRTCETENTGVPYRLAI
jgi:hypothetical protein